MQFWIHTSEMLSGLFLDSGFSYGFFDLISVYLKTVDHLNLFIVILLVLRFDFQKFRILEILNFHPCTHMLKHALIQKVILGSPGLKI